ncbi:hypothetical protein [Azospirillum endophyticum]|nr:hypothetical protein [Azospirillum endophyticum]
MMAAAIAAMLAVAAVLPAAAEPLLSAPESGAPLPSSLPSPEPVAAPPPLPVAVQAPAKPQTDAFDCWLLDSDRLEQASGHGLCGDAFARAPETASLPEAPPPPAVTPMRKPKIPERRVRSSSRSSSHSEAHAMAASGTRSPRSGGGGDFFSNFQRDFNALTDLLGSGSSPGRSDGRNGIASHMSHNH